MCQECRKSHVRERGQFLIESLRDSIERGTYHVPSEQLAEQLLSLDRPEVKERYFPLLVPRSREN